MKQKIFAILLALTLMLSLTACGGVDNSADVAKLQEEVTALQQQVDALSARVEALEQRSGLESWELQPTVWANGNGAAVRFTAVPVNYAEGMSVSFVVRLSGQEVAAVDCAWDGTCFAASVDLEAADGYGYYCVLTAADGSREQLALNTPENPVDDTLVYLRTSLVAYGNLVVESWYDADGKLTITSGYVQVQMPRISTNGSQITYSSADLVLQFNGQELARTPLDLPDGEGEGSYELVLTDLVFDMPEMEDADQLELWLEVSLSTGEELLATGGSWFCSDGELLLAVG